MGATAREFLNVRMSYIDELFNAEPHKINQIEDLLKNAIIQHEEKQEIYRELKSIEDQRADELIEYLYKNQICPIQSGANYTQTDIKNKLNKEL